MQGQRLVPPRGAGPPRLAPPRRVLRHLSRRGVRGRVKRRPRPSRHCRARPGSPGPSQRHDATWTTGSHPATTLKRVVGQFCALPPVAVAPVAIDRALIVLAVIVVAVVAPEVVAIPATVVVLEVG